MESTADLFRDRERATLPRGWRLAPRAALLALALCGPATAPASTLEYTIELPPGQVVAYHVEFEVDHPGWLAIEADWSGSRVLSFRIDGPGSLSLRRSGPPPQRLVHQVDPVAAGNTETWKLSIRGLPSRSASTGSLRLILPDPPAPPVPETATGAAAGEPTPAAEAWAVPRQPPPALAAGARRVFETTERFRALILDAEPKIPDSYRWQTELMRYLAQRRDHMAETGEPPVTEATRKVLTRVVEAVRRVEELRLSDDPFFNEPAPRDRARLQAWLIVRQRRTAPLRQELDAVFNDIQRGLAPGLERERWPVRLLSCLTACERHFEERGRMSADRAVFGVLARDQWDRILAAAEALESLAASD